MLTTKSFSTVSAVLIALSFSTAHAASPEGKETLQDIEMSAATVADQADQLVQYSFSNQLTAQSHLIMLMAIVEDVNKMGREMATLEAERDSLPKWEQRASDKALPLLQETAANTKKAIEFADQNRSRLWSADYRGYATTIWKDSEQMAKTIRDYLKYASAHRTEEQLEQTLGTPTD